MESDLARANKDAKVASLVVPLLLLVLVLVLLLLVVGSCRKLKSHHVSGDRPPSMTMVLVARVTSNVLVKLCRRRHR